MSYVVCRSALDVERVLLEHPAIAECAVVGLPDPAFGQTITAVVVLKQVHHDTTRHAHNTHKTQHIATFPWL
jgi:acyl-coenzyme A synthetase/AMP-(fatty) acid ligase